MSKWSQQSILVDAAAKIFSRTRKSVQLIFLITRLISQVRYFLRSRVILQSHSLGIDISCLEVNAKFDSTKRLHVGVAPRRLEVISSQFGTYMAWRGAPSYYTRVRSVQYRTRCVVSEFEN